MKITRRQFLAGLISFGASIVLPVSLAEATPAQIDTAWKKLLKDPWYFEVNDSRTIIDGSVQQPRLRRDVFDIEPGGNSTIEGLISEIAYCAPLDSHFRQLALDEFSEAEYRLANDDDLTGFERIKLKRLMSALQKNGDGWADWIRLEGAGGRDRFVNEVEDWLAETINWNESDYFPKYSTAQGSAMAFFERMPYGTLNALGVAIIEGEHPGSSYYAAELHSPIDDANLAAQALELPFRFREEGSAHPKAGA